MIQHEITRAALAQFDVWTELADPERPPWLAALAISDPALYQRLSALIEADRQASEQPFLRAPTVPGDLIGMVFGAWRTECLIGTGGMAQVWLARRGDGLYDGVAAIKLLRLASVD